ncbi:MAG: pantoate--beta-alanine ligase [Actinomycetaceae bacterium]|nr:pantoate--beta-alanine ligase [Actinomycetaceae bacterium]
MVQILRTKEEARQFCASLEGDVCLVMTMGALHQGHMSLVRAAKNKGEHVIVSIFVNPLQFGENEDFDAYPRQLDDDIALLETENIDAVFAPSEKEMYPRLPHTRIQPGSMASTFEGKTRPGHFAGVLQIVAKVFHIIQPHYAFFGQKDSQQLALIRAMVDDLDFPVKICGVPLQRDENGLALSSRNEYLSDEEKEHAYTLNRALYVGKDVADNGGGIHEVGIAARACFEENPAVRLDYCEIVSPDTYEPIEQDTYEGKALIICAAWVGKTRLIDNMEVHIHG